MEMLMSFEAKAAAKKGRQAAFDGKQEGRLRHAGRAEMISSEPIAWNGLVEDQCEERQKQAKTAEQAIVTKESMSAIDVADARGSSLAISADKASSDFEGLRACEVC